jgi:uncharacterized protein YcfL
MELTPEEKQKIYEEEKARQEAKNKIKAKNTSIGCLVFIGIAIILYIIGSSGTNKTSTTSSSAVINNSSKVAELEVIKYEAKYINYNAHIVGTVKNNSAKEFSYVQVEFNLYDESGAQVGSTLDNTNNLEAYGTWKFDAVCIEEFKKYKLKGISGF